MPTGTAGSRRLGARLKALRIEQAERVGTSLSVAMVAEDLGWKRWKLMRIESGGVSLTPGDLTKMLDLYQATPEQRASLEDILETAGTDWWLRYRDVMPGALQEYIEYEAAARRIVMGNSDVMPGLLQTRAYASAVYACQPHYPDPDQAARLVEIRMNRQRVITEEGVDLVATIDEALLHRRTGGRDVLREQLTRLLEFVELPNVVVRVVPFTAERAILIGGITLFDFHADDAEAEHDPSVVFSEHEGSMLLRNSDIDVRRFRRQLDHLAAQALSSEESSALIRTRMEKL